MPHREVCGLFVASYRSLGVSDKLVSCGVAVRALDHRSRAVTRQRVNVFSRIATGSSLWSRGHIESPLPERTAQQHVQQQGLIDKNISGSESRSDQLRDRHPFVMLRILVGRSSCLLHDSKILWKTSCQWSSSVSHNNSGSTRSPAGRLAKRRLIDQRRRRSPLSLARPTRIAMIRLNGNKRVLEFCPAAGVNKPQARVWGPTTRCF